MTVSAVILELPSHRSIVRSVEEIGKKMADKKKPAKISAEKICVVRLNDINELITISNGCLESESSTVPLYQSQPKIDLSEFNHSIFTHCDSLSPACEAELFTTQDDLAAKSREVLGS